MKRDILRNVRQETNLYKRRMLIAMFFTLFLFFALLLRLYYLQVVQYRKYATLSDNNRIALLPIPPNRGLIYDRNGVLIADNMPTYALHIVPEQTDDLDATIATVSELIELRDQDKERFYKELKRRRRFESVPLLFNVSEDDAATIAVNSYRLPGVNITAGLLRHYPLGEEFSHITGYVGRINEAEVQQIDAKKYRSTQFIGKTGIEKFYEAELLGQVGFEKVETDVRGRILRSLETIPSVPGQNLYLTIDSRLQLEVEKLMENLRGAIVALDPRTGEVLAFVSHPNYDPNLFVKGIDHETYRKLTHDIDQPLFNRALRGQYPPASTIKPIFALEGLQTGTITTTTTIRDHGYFQLANSSHVYRDWRKNGHGTVDVDTAIIESCDTFFYTLANMMGIRRLSEVMFMFGLGSRTGIDISGELPGLVPTPEWKRANKKLPWYPGETVITGIGQGFTTVTPVQLAHMTAALASNGVRIQPHVVRELEAPNGERHEMEPKTYPPVNMSSTFWRVVKNAMVGVIHSYRGTASYLSNSPYKLAGKTGTAQVFSVRQEEEYDASVIEERLRDHSLFIGFAPADNPTIALAVIIENNKGAPRFARRVFDAYFKLERETPP